jgi:CRISPR-associated protein Cas2
MLIISYDIKDDKLRTNFSKFLCKFGYRLQYSVFHIKNSKRILENILKEITNTYEKKFDQNDSVYIFNLSENCKITRFGYAKNEEHDTIIIV